jgi:hypothetical protein
MRLYLAVCRRKKRLRGAEILEILFGISPYQGYLVSPSLGNRKGVKSTYRSREYMEITQELNRGYMCSVGSVGGRFPDITQYRAIGRVFVSNLNELRADFASSYSAIPRSYARNTGRIRPECLQSGSLRTFANQPTVAQGSRHINPNQPSNPNPNEASQA